MRAMTGSSTNRRVLASVGAALAVVAGMLAVPAAPALAASLCDDSTGPVLVSLAKSRTSVNVTAKRATVTFTARATDDISGVSSINLYLSSPTKKGTTRSAYATLHKASGTVTNGVWKGTATIPRWTIDGTWHITTVYLQDRVGNPAFYSEVQLVAPPISAKTTLKVTSNPDLVKPTLSGLSFTPKSVNTKAAAKTVKVTATIRDKGGSGASGGYITFSRNSGAKAYGTIGILNHKKGTAHTYVGSAVVPRYADVKSPVIWRATVTVFDNAANYRTYTTASLTAKKRPTKLKVTTTPDTKAPVMKSVGVSPTSVDVTASAKKVTVTARMTDNLSGVSSVTLAFQGTSFFTLNATLNLSSGTRRAGTWKGTVTVPLCQASDTYKLSQLRSTDRTGNVRTYGDPALPDKTITVVGKT